MLLVEFFHILLRILKGVVRALHHVLVVGELTFLPCILLLLPTIQINLVPLLQILLFLLLLLLLLILLGTILLLLLRRRVNRNDAVACRLKILELLPNSLLLLQQQLFVLRTDLLLNRRAALARRTRLLLLAALVENVADLVPDVPVLLLPHLRILQLLRKRALEHVLQFTVNFPLRLDRHARGQFSLQAQHRFFNEVQKLQILGILLPALRLRLHLGVPKNIIEATLQVARVDLRAELVDLDFFAAFADAADFAFDGVEAGGRREDRLLAAFVHVGAEADYLQLVLRLKLLLRLPQRLQHLQS